MFVHLLSYFLFSASILITLPPPPVLCHKLQPQWLRFEFQNNADVLSEGEASIMCSQAGDGAVLHSNAEATCWLCGTFRVERNLFHVLSLSSPVPICLGHFCNVAFKRGSHENIEDWVEAAVEKRDALCDLNGNIHAFAHAAVGDQGVDDVYGLAELDNVIRQLSNNEDYNHCKQNFEGPRFFNVWCLDEYPGRDKVADSHDKKGHDKPYADFQHLNRCFH